MVDEVLILQHLETSLAMDLFVLTLLRDSGEERSFEVIASLDTVEIIPNYVLSDEEINRLRLINFHLVDTEYSREERVFMCHYVLVIVHHEVGFEKDS